MITRRPVLAGLSALGASLPVAAFGQGAPSFYKDKQITMLVGTAAGGGYDTYARTFACHMTKYIPGNPVIVVKNMPGADGAIATQTLYNSAPRDGTTIAALTNGIAMDSLFKRFVGRFDALKLGWIGSISKLMNVCVTWYTEKLQMEIDPLKGEEIEALLSVAYSAPKPIVAEAASLLP
jgi:tripartite-type tricarboxylate transporter receptor subunit TctC